MKQRTRICIGAALAMMLSMAAAAAKAYVEVDGKVAAEKEVWTRKLTFREIAL